MTWREFHLRKIGFERAEKREWYRTREVGYASLIGGGVDPKKLTKEKYIPLDGPQKSTSIMTDSMKEALAKAREIAQKQIDGSRT